MGFMVDGDSGLWAHDLALLMGRGKLQIVDDELANQSARFALVML